MVFEVNGNKPFLGSESRTVRFVTRKWAPAIGGMETYCHRLTEELAKSRPLDVIALAGKANGRAPSTLALLVFGIATAFKLLFRPPVAICHFGDMAIWPLAYISRLRHDQTKYIISAHGTDVSFPLRGGLMGNLYGWFLRLGARLMPRMTVIANSQATAEACEIAGYSKVHIISLASDLQPSKPQDSKPRHLLFAGRLIKVKGLAWFVDNVLPLLPPEIIVKVAGTVWDKAEQNALTNPRVQFLGQLQSDMLAQEYANAICVILPNITVLSKQFEGYGLVATEAAAAGGVAVASYHGGLKEALLDNQTGFHVAAGDAQAWADKINDIVAWDSKKRAEFIENARNVVNIHYRWDRVASETAALY